MRLLLAAFCALTMIAAPAVAEPTRSFAGEARLLVDRDEAWETIMGLVAGAKRSIAVDYYVLGGPRAIELARELARRHREGLAVRVMLDPDLGTLPALKALTTPVLHILRDAGVPVRLYPRDVLARKHGYRFVEDHNKVVVADGQAAFVGSMNVGADILHNHDVGVRVEGQVANAIGGEIARAFVLATPMGHEELRPWPAADLPTRLGSDEIAYFPTGLAGRHGRPAVLKALAEAKEAVRVMMFELEDPDAEAALLAAHRRGVDVRVLVDPNDLTNLSPLGWAPRGVFNLGVASRLAAAGVAVRWYRPAADEHALHAKAALVDNTLLVGSTNWNFFSFDLNNETMLAIGGGEAPRRFAQVFDADWADRSDPVSERPSASRLLLYRGLAFLLN
ncbi:MAG: phospholipase D/Transphosphatidylase [Cyanobacteria bacterium RYN_339]|nr:phospholipase D/Transphosphatidylase [Cyanobacteria bacterium RYN_339]